jgi:hypothetical protein
LKHTLLDENHIDNMPIILSRDSAYLKILAKSPFDLKKPPCTILPSGSSSDFKLSSKKEGSIKMDERNTSDQAENSLPKLSARIQHALAGMGVWVREQLTQYSRTEVREWQRMGLNVLIGSGAYSRRPGYILQEKLL